MQRRQYLALSTTALAALAAGCTGGDGDDGAADDDGDQNGDDEDDGIDDGGPTPTPAEDNLNAFRNDVEGAGFEVLDLYEEDGIVTLDYTSDAADEDAVVEEAEPILEAFGDQLAAGWEVEWLEVWLIGEDGSETASYILMAQWVADWHAGESSDDEFFDQVRGEIQQY